MNGEVILASGLVFLALAAAGACVLKRKLKHAANWYSAHPQSTAWDEYEATSKTGLGASTEAPGPSPLGRSSSRAACSRRKAHATPRGGGLRR